MIASQLPQPTLQEISESFKEVELTEEEISLAILEAKVRKRKQEEAFELRKREAEERKKFTQKTNYHLVKGLMLLRAGKKFDPIFNLDSDNEMIFELLCRYFGEDKEFVSIAQSAGVDNPSLEKGIMLCGVFGTGKTWMMELFKSNQRQCFDIVTAKEISEEYRIYKQDKSKNYEDPLHRFLIQTKNAFEDPSVFYQPFSGMCIDDIGTEDLKNSFGNKKNVIGDIIEIRYTEKIFGPCFHATTNLTADQIDQYYGGRVRSRMRQMFNFIELPGKDRRK